MNCVSLKRSLPLEDDQQDTFSAKRRRQERKSTKLPDIIDPNVINCPSPYLWSAVSFRICLGVPCSNKTH